jgi:negative regulator of sigma E activity
MASSTDGLAKFSLAISLRWARSSSSSRTSASATSGSTRATASSAAANATVSGEMPPAGMPSCEKYFDRRVPSATES